MLTCLIIFSTIVKAETINKIEIDGLNTISRGTVLNLIGIEVNDNIAPQNVKTAYENLTDSNFFSKVALSVKDNILLVGLVENPTIKYFEINGYKEDEVLTEKIISDIQKNFNFDLEPG